MDFEKIKKDEDNKEKIEQLEMELNKIHKESSTIYKVHINREAKKLFDKAKSDIEDYYNSKGLTETKLSKSSWEYSYKDFKVSIEFDENEEPRYNKIHIKIPSEQKYLTAIIVEGPNNDDNAKSRIIEVTSNKTAVQKIEELESKIKTALKEKSEVENITFTFVSYDEPQFGMNSTEIIKLIEHVFKQKKRS